MLEYSGVEYEYNRIDPNDPHDQAALNAVDPSGRLPFLVDGNVELHESVAISFYVAEQYAPQLWPASVAERAAIYDWSMWVATVLHDRFRLATWPTTTPEAEVAKRRQQLQKPLDVLERGLEGRGYLVGQSLYGCRSECGLDSEPRDEGRDTRSLLEGMATRDALAAVMGESLCADPTRGHVLLI